MASTEPEELWTRRSVRAVLAGNLVVAAVLVVCWWSAAGAVTVAEQVATVNLGVASLIVGGAGNALFLRRGRRAVVAAIDWRQHR